MPRIVDEVIEIFNDSVVPAAKSQKGYSGAYLLTDRKTGKGYALSLWDSEEDAVANEQSGYYKEQVGIRTVHDSTPCSGRIGGHSSRLRKYPSDHFLIIYV